jgi:hypothetical protein
MGQLAGFLSNAVLIATTFTAGTIATPRQSPVPRPQPCVGPAGAVLKLEPRDEGLNRADFVVFRRRLQTLLVERNEPSLLSIVHPEVRAGFDGADGIDGFKRQHLNNPDEDFWQEFARILIWGGRFVEPSQFVAPYVFAFWPQEADSFECLAVVGTRVRLRERPRASARTLDMLSHVIVQVVQGEPGTIQAAGWRRVRSAAGRSGYMSERYLRSPVDHRAVFEFRNGRWWLVAYLAGD